MKEHHWIVLGVLVYTAYRWNQSQSGTNALAKAYANEAAALKAMDGTNFTQSLWDPVSGQPAYMFGTVPVPSANDVYMKAIGAPMSSSVFGHM